MAEVEKDEKIAVVIGPDDPFSRVVISLQGKNVKGQEKINWLASQFKVSSRGEAKELSARVYRIGDCLSIVLRD